MGGWGRGDIVGGGECKKTKNRKNIKNNSNSLYRIPSCLPKVKQKINSMSREM